ncbi:MAG: hypothetical protein HC929_05850 [Leptolyngbyaceae cyanobacterium SM2_5_2]|nr:hypothetical protein [Leptolyngbyaceae cyanobacterium SM2_5_2]
MNTPVLFSKNEGRVKAVTLLLWGYVTIFFPRALTMFGAPAALNFVHFAFVPVISGVILLTAPLRNRVQARIVRDLGFAVGLLLASMVASALLNQAGLINVFVYFIILAEPYILLMAMVMVPLVGKNLERFRRWIIIFSIINFAMALSQWIFIPIGIYPKPEGGTLQDNITGVFGGGGGSAANYISCTITIYVGMYVFNHYKSYPIWLRSSLFLAGIFQAQISDSKQVFLALLGGGVLLVVTKVNYIQKMLMYAIVMGVIMGAFYWAIFNLDYEFLGHYRNWLDREGLYGPDGAATLTKTAAFRIIPTYYTSVLNWLIGIGPGHGVSRLGGWVLRDYASLLMPLGATIHPASQEVFQVVTSGWIAQESTVYFPLFTWAGIWGDLGFVGLFSYLYLACVAWRWFCVDDMCKFFMLSTAVFGFILTQMEEPAQVVTIAVLLGLRWHEEQAKRQAQMNSRYNLVTSIEDPFRTLPL